MAGLAIREATTADMITVQAIYAHEVLHGVATFEEAAPSVEEMQARQARIASNGLPYLVAEAEGKVAGYCYAGLYHARSAYRFTIENTVYVDAAMRGRGIGAALMQALVAACEAGHWRQMIAAISVGNDASIAIHRRFGFEPVGTMKEVGFKFGRWIDVAYMQRALCA